MTPRQAALVLLALALAAATRRVEPAPASRTPRALSIEEAMQLAVERTEGVDAARAAVRRARAEVRSARSAYWPQLSGQVTYDRTLASEFEGLFDEAPPDMMGGAFEDLPFGRENVWQIGAVLSQEIWNFGRTSSLVARARAAAEQAEVGLSTATASAALDAARAYYDALLAGELLGIAEVTLAQTEETLRVTRLGFEQGTIAEFDLLRAEVARDNQASVVVQRRSDRDLAVLRLLQSVGLPLDRPVALTSPLERAELVAELRADGPEAGGAGAAVGAAPRAVGAAEIRRAAALVSRRAPVREARAEVSASEALAGAARAARWPSLGVRSSFGLVNYPERILPTDDWRTNWTVGVVLSIPIFTGFRTSAEIESAEADLGAARARLSAVRRAAVVDTVTADEQVAVARATWRQAARTVRQARRAHEIAELRFQQGIATQLDLVDARLLLDQARINRARAARDLEVALLRRRLLPDLPLEVAPTGAATGIARPQAGVELERELERERDSGLETGGAAPAAREGEAVTAPGRVR